MIKAFGIVMIVFSSSMIGIIKSKKLSQRVVELELALLILDRIITEIKYRRTPTKKIIELLLEEDIFKKANYIVICNQKLKINSNFPEVWKQSIDISGGALIDHDKKRIKVIGDILGSSEVTCQISGIELTIDMLKQNLKEAKEIKEKQGKFYRNIGILSGIGIGIMML